MGVSCCWRMMVIKTSLTISSVFVLFSGFFVEFGLAESSFPSNLFERLYSDLSSDYQVPEYRDVPETETKPQENNQKPNKDLGKGHLKNGVLPAYCDPPNPCPKGYTSEDGCIEMNDFENKADFSRKYQASQNCMCDTEHMFSCPDVNNYQQQEVDMPFIELPGFDEVNNPFLTGSKLPIAAKKGMGY